MGRLPDNLSGLAVDQFHSCQPLGRFGVEISHAIHGVPIQIATELVIAADQTGDCIAHGGDVSSLLLRETSTAEMIETQARLAIWGI